MESQRFQLPIQLIEDNARFDSNGALVDIDVEEAVAILREVEL